MNKLRGMLLRALETLAVIAAVLGLAYAALPLYESDALHRMQAEAVAAQEFAPAFTVVLDAGHGGRDGGAVGPAGVPEAGVNLAIVALLKAELERAGVEAVLTRQDENALAEGKQADMRARRDIMNAEGVDAVVSVHLNKFRDTSVSGPMAFYFVGSTEGERLASEVIRAVCAAVERPPRLANPGDYYVIRESVPPAVIVECGFLSNAADEARLLTQEYQRLLAGGIAAGVLAYLGVQGGA